LLNLSKRQVSVISFQIAAPPLELLLDQSNRVILAYAAQVGENEKQARIGQVKNEMHLLETKISFTETETELIGTEIRAMTCDFSRPISLQASGSAFKLLAFFSTYHRYLR